MPECDTRIRPPAPLVDARPFVNQFIVQALAAAQVAPNGAARVDRVYEMIGAAITTNPLSNDFNKSRIEGHLEGLAGAVVYPLRQAWTKYAGVTYGVWSPRVLSPTLRIGEIHIGLDKLGHFVQQGYQYYRMVQGAGGTLEEAKNWGHQSELDAAPQPGFPFIAAYGLRSTGVYSRADLEANLKGYEFYLWVEQNRSVAFDIGAYVNADWNEEQKPSYYHSEIWETVWANLLAGRWQGFFTRGTGPARTAVAFTFTAQGATMQGTYQYAGNPAHVGNMAGNVMPFTPAPGHPVAGVVIPWSWTRGGLTGRGLWSSENTEHRLVGTWGIGQSPRDGGRIVIERV